MPVAKSFTAEGLGTGFPFCVPKLDVSGYKYVAPMTLQQASLVFWNLYRVKWSSAPPSDADALGNVYEEELIPPPKNRVCGGTGTSNIWIGDIITNEPSVGLNIGVNIIYKLYDGDVDVETNHIGYGLPWGFLVYQSGRVAFRANVYGYGSFAEDTDPIYIPASFESWWWDQPTNFGGVLNEFVDPDSVGTIGMTVVVGGGEPNIQIPLLQAAWQVPDLLPASRVEKLYLYSYP